MFTILNDNVPIAKLTWEQINLAVAIMAFDCNDESWEEFSDVETLIDWLLWCNMLKWLPEWSEIKWIN